MLKYILNRSKRGKNVAKSNARVSQHTAPFQILEEDAKFSLELEKIQTSKKLAKLAVTM